MTYDSDGCFEETLYLSEDDKYLQYLNVGRLMIINMAGQIVRFYVQSFKNDLKCNEEFSNPQTMESTQS